MENLRKDEQKLENMIGLVGVIFILAFMVLPFYPTYAMMFLIGSLTGLMIYYAIN